MDRGHGARDRGRSVCGNRPRRTGNEVSDLGKRERRQITSALRILLLHMLKMKYRPEKQTPSWELSILEERRRVGRYLRESPSFRASLDELVADAYEDALYHAERETGLSLVDFPERCEWNIEEVLGK
jgi:Domain of unknown function DUF29